MNNNLITVKNILNSKIVTPGHKELGEIEDIAIHEETGRIAYLVLKMSNFLGFDEKRFPIPFGAFYTDTNEEGKIILDVDKERLENAPELEISEDKDFNYTEFIIKVYDYYGIKPYLTDYSHEIDTDISNVGANMPATMERNGMDSTRIENNRSRAKERYKKRTGMGVSS